MSDDLMGPVARCGKIYCCTGSDSCTACIARNRSRERHIKQKCAHCLESSLTNTYVPCCQQAGPCVHMDAVQALERFSSRRLLCAGGDSVQGLHGNARLNAGASETAIRGPSVQPEKPPPRFLKGSGQPRYLKGSCYHWSQHTERHAGQVAPLLTNCTGLVWRSRTIDEPVMGADECLTWPSVCGDHAVEFKLNVIETLLHIALQKRDGNQDSKAMLEKGASDDGQALPWLKRPMPCKRTGQIRPRRHENGYNAAAQIKALECTILSAGALLSWYAIVATAHKHHKIFALYARRKGTRVYVLPSLLICLTNLPLECLPSHSEA